MPDTLTERQQEIVLAVVDEYVKNAKPVGSEDLLKARNFSWSSATIRNEMAVLEEKGYLYQPHISSGRVPTDRGYRFFVNYITEKRLQKMDIKKQKRLEEELLKLKAREKMLVRTLAKLMSSFSHNLAITGLVEEKQFFESGIKELVSQPDFQKIDNICQIAEIIDYLDENIEKLSQKISPRKVETFIGEEDVFTKSGDCSIVISECLLPGGEKGIVAILGPKRMEYRQNISLVENVVKFLKNET